MPFGRGWGVGGQVGLDEAQRFSELAMISS
jgi:hypothetical protein